MNILLALQAASMLFDYAERISKSVNGPEPTIEEIKARDAVREEIVNQSNLLKTVAQNPTSS